MAAQFPQGSSYRTDHPYNLSPEHEAEVIEKMSFTTTGPKNSAITFPREEDDIINQIEILNTGPRVIVTGDTNRRVFISVPYDIWHMILDDDSLTLQDIFRLRQVHPRLRQVINTMRKYAAITTYALTTYRALFCTGLAIKCNLNTLFHLLCTASCIICGNFSTFIYLPTALRCCYECLQHASQTLTTSMYTLNLTSYQDYVPRVRQDSPLLFKTIPGFYGPRERKSWRRVVAIAATDVLGNDPTTWSAIVHRALQDVGHYRYMASCEMPYLDPRADKVQPGRLCRGCREAKSVPHQYTQFDQHLNVDTASKRIYSDEGFLGHFRHCGVAQTLWENRQ